MADEFPGRQSRALLPRAIPASARRISAVAILKQVILTRGARGIFYDTRDLLKLIRGTYNNEVKTTELDVLRPVMEADLLVLDDLGRREDVGMGRRNAEPHRQHALQRAARHDLYVELSGLAARLQCRRHHPARSHRVPHALAAARDVRLSRSRGRRLPDAAAERRRAGAEAHLGRTSDARKARSGRAARTARRKRRSARRRQSRPKMVWWPRRLHNPNRESRTWIMCPGLYVHVPFCSAICNYCNFNRGLYDDALKARVRRCAAAGDGKRGRVQFSRKAGRKLLPTPFPCPDTLYFGGGTPSLLAPADIAAIIDRGRGRSLGLAPTPRSRSRPTPRRFPQTSLEHFRRAGVNRLSFGVQSFRDEELKRLGRAAFGRTGATKPSGWRGPPGSTTSASIS